MPDDGFGVECDEFTISGRAHHGGRRNDADAVTRRNTLHALAYRFDDAGRLQTQARRQRCRLDVGAGPQQRLGPVDAQRLDPDLNLPRPGWCHINMFNAKNLGTAEFVKADYACHLPSTPKRLKRMSYDD